MGKRLIGSVGLKPGTDTGFDLDEKGQIHGYTDTQFALPVGDDDQIITADSGEASGLKWIAFPGLASPLSSDLVFNDNVKAIFGTGSDSSISYNGTNMLLDPKVAGSGVLSIAGRIQGMETGTGFAKCELLDHHIATGTASSYTFTPGTPLDIQSTYGKIIVFFSGVNTASLAMQVKIDGIADYDYSKLLADTTTVSTALTTAAAAFEVVGTELIDGNSAFWGGQLELWSQQSSGSTDRCMIRSSGWTAHEGQQHTYGNPGTGDTEEIATIEVLTSTSTWTANTEIWIYGMLR